MEVTEAASKRQRIEGGGEGEEHPHKQPRTEAPESEDVYWSTLPEMRGEIQKHMTLLYRFNLLRTRKAAYTVDAQRKLLIDALWADFILFMYARRTLEPLPKPDYDRGTMGIFEWLEDRLTIYLATTTTPQLSLEKNVPNSIFREMPFKTFLATLDLSSLKNMYRNFVIDVSSALADFIGAWIQTLFHDRGAVLYERTLAKENQFTSVNIYIYDSDGYTLYAFGFSFWSTSARGGGTLPALRMFEKIPTRMRTRSPAEISRVAKCQELMAALPYGDVEENVARLIDRGLQPLFRTLLLEVDPGIAVQLDYDVMRELGFFANPNLFAEHVAPTRPDEDYIYMSRVSAMQIVGYLKKKGEEE